LVGSRTGKRLPSRFYKRAPWTSFPFPVRGRISVKCAIRAGCAFRGNAPTEILAFRHRGDFAVQVSGDRSSRNYVNGDHVVQNAAVKSVDGAPQLKVRQIENEFLKKMFAET